MLLVAVDTVLVVIAFLTLDLVELIKIELVSRQNPAFKYNSYTFLLCCGRGFGKAVPEHNILLCFNYASPNYSKKSFDESLFSQSWFKGFKCPSEGAGASFRHFVRPTSPRDPLMTYFFHSALLKKRHKCLFINVVRHEPPQRLEVYIPGRAIERT